MTKPRSSGLGCCFLAALLLGAPMMSQSMAKPVHKHLRFRASLKPHPVAELSASQTIEVRAGKAAKAADQGILHADRGAEKTNTAANRNSMENGNAENLPGKHSQAGAKDTGGDTPATHPPSVEFHVTDLGPIDTRIAVLPRRGTELGKARQEKNTFKLIPHSYAHVHRSNTTSHSTARNAIAVPLNPTAGAVGAQTDAQPAASGGAAPAPHPQRVVSLPASGVISRDSGNIKPISRATTNGRTMGRPMTTASAIRGAPRNAGGVIDGTTFRRRHP